MSIYLQQESRKGIPSAMSGLPNNNLIRYFHIVLLHKFKELMICASESKGEIVQTAVRIQSEHL